MASFCLICSIITRCPVLLYARRRQPNLALLHSCIIIHVPFCIVLPPTGLSAVHTNSTTIRLYWTPPTATPTGYNITYFAGAEDTTGTAVSVSGGSTNSHEIPNLNDAVTYRVSIVSVNGTTRSDTTGPVLAARGKYTLI